MRPFCHGFAVQSLTVLNGCNVPVPPGFRPVSRAGCSGFALCRDSPKFKSVPIKYRIIGHVTVDFSVPAGWHHYCIKKAVRVNETIGPTSCQVARRRRSMKRNRVVSLAEYKAQLLCAAQESDQSTSGMALPGADRLWELLDRNISLTVWVKGH